MEEDIKILEEKVELYYDCAVIDEDGFDMRVDIAFMKKDAQALENLIKGYREMEEKGERLQNKLLDTMKGSKIIEEETPQYIKENYIPKSKIKEKIEELEKQKEETYTKFLGGNRKDEFLSTKGKMLEGATRVLQELIEEE